MARRAVWLVAARLEATAAHVPAPAVAANTLVAAPCCVVFMKGPVRKRVNS